MRYQWQKFCSVGAATAWAVALMFVAQQASAQDAVSQTVGHGQINWTSKTITATGSGAPNLNAANVAVARLGAERAAKTEALRNIIEAVKGVQVSSTTSAGQLMDESPEIRSKVEGIVRNFKVLDTKYYSDGGVDVIVEVPLDGVLTDALVEGKGTAASGGDGGVVINAVGLGAKPALAPRILDEEGNEVYGTAVASPEAVQKHGVAGYSKSLKAAMKDIRLGPKPVVLKAVRLTEPGSTDLVISNDDAKKLKGLGGALAAARVIIVTD